MPGLFAKVAQFARSPQGRALTKKAVTYARSPEGKQRIADTRQKLASRRPPPK